MQLCTSFPGDSLKCTGHHDGHQKYAHVPPPFRSGLNFRPSLALCTHRVNLTNRNFTLQVLISETGFHLYCCKLHEQRQQQQRNRCSCLQYYVPITRIRGVMRRRKLSCLGDGGCQEWVGRARTKTDPKDGNPSHTFLRFYVHVVDSFLSGFTPKKYNSAATFSPRCVRVTNAFVRDGRKVI